MTENVCVSEMKLSIFSFKLFFLYMNKHSNQTLKVWNSLNRFRKKIYIYKKWRGNNRHKKIILLISFFCLFIFCFTKSQFNDNQFCLVMILININKKMTTAIIQFLLFLFGVEIVLISKQVNITFKKKAVVAHIDITYAHTYQKHNDLHD